MECIGIFPVKYFICPHKRNKVYCIRQIIPPAEHLIANKTLTPKIPNCSSIPANIQPLIYRKILDIPAEHLREYNGHH